MRPILVAGVLVATPVFASSARAQGSLEVTATHDLDGSKARGKLAFGLPWKVSGFSFAQVSGDADAYFAMTILEKAVAPQLGAQLQALSGSGFRDSVGPGLSLRLPLGDDANVSLNFVPLRLNTEGKLLVDRLALGYFADYDFGGGWVLTGFGGMNLLWADGPEWGYGETYLTRTLTSQWTLGVGADVLGGNDDHSAEVNPGIMVRFTPP